MTHPSKAALPAAIGSELVPAVLRGIGQVFFQENALTGALFTLGIALSSLSMAAAALLASAIGLATARFFGFDRDEILAGIYGFNATLVGIATLVFFRPGLASLSLLVLGSIAATLITRAMRRHLPFPTYTTPFIVTTWVIYFLAPALGAVGVEAARAEAAATPSLAMFSMDAVFKGVGQVMFQASLWTGLFFVLGIALNDWRHALWVVLASFVGMIVAAYHAGAPLVELPIDRAHAGDIAQGLFGYNATLVAVALYLWRRSLIPILMGIVLSVPLTELVPLVGLPALTAPFVLATWLVMGCDRLDSRLFGMRGAAAR